MQQVCTVFMFRINQIQFNHQLASVANTEA